MSIYGKFFGQYLVESGVVTERQIAEGLGDQRGANSRLGELAMERGLLTRAQVDEIVAEQKRRDHLFGRVAVSKGLLTPEQLATLLQLQAQRHLQFGESLVRMGLVEREEMDRLIKTFQESNAELERRLIAAITALPEGRLVRTVAETIQRFFTRAIGSQAKVSALSSGNGMPPEGDLFVVWRKARPDKKTFAYGFSLSRWHLSSLIFCLLERETSNERVIHETLLDFAQVIDYAVVGELSDEGLSYGLDDAAIMKSWPPDLHAAVRLAISSAIGDFTAFVAETSREEAT